MLLAAAFMIASALAAYADGPSTVGVRYSDCGEQQEEAERAGGRAGAAASAAEQTSQPEQQPEQTSQPEQQPEQTTQPEQQPVQPEQPAEGMIASGGRYIDPTKPYGGVDI